MQTRRGFLRMLGIGAVAAPMLVKASAKNEYRAYIQFEDQKIPILVSDDNKDKLNRLFDECWK
jgi:hypothetical protein